MSRVGKKPVEIPAGVKPSMDGNRLSFKGPKGELSVAMVEDITCVVEDGRVVLSPRNNLKHTMQMWGLQRSLVNNCIMGVTEGFSEVLEISGVGYRANVQGKSIKLQLGFSHDVDFPIPEGITIKTPEPTVIEISGIDKQQVGQVAANIRNYRRPEPYKGKGIRYRDEYVYRKEGKKK